MPADVSSSGGSTATPAASPSPAELQRTVEQMTRVVQELRDAERAVGRRTVLATLLLIAVIAGFVVFMLRTVRANLTPEKLQVAATLRAQQAMPQIQPQVQLIIDDVVPYYTQMGQQRFKAFGPKLDVRVRQQTDQLGQELETKVNAQVEATFVRITNAAMAKLAQDFPAIAKDGGARATQRLKSAMADETNRLSAHTRDLYKVQSDRISASLARFPVPDVSKSDMDTLQRQLLHDLLMLADHELTNEGKPQASPAKLPEATK